MPDYHALKNLCDDVASALEAAETDCLRWQVLRGLKAAEEAALRLYRGIVVAQVEIEENNGEQAVAALKETRDR